MHLSLYHYSICSPTGVHPMMSLMNFYIHQNCLVYKLSRLKLDLGNCNAMHTYFLFIKHLAIIHDILCHRCKYGTLSVSAGSLKHRVVCYGYVIHEDNIPGKYVHTYIHILMNVIMIDYWLTS